MPPTKEQKGAAGEEKSSPANSTGGETYARRVRDAFQSAFNLPDGMPPLVRYFDYQRFPTATAFELVEPARTRRQ